MNIKGLLAMCLGYFIVIMDVTIVNVALPSIAQGLHCDISWLQWIVDGYTLLFACFLLIAGHISDQFGPKKCFLLGTLFFTLNSFCAGVATNAFMLTVFRILQGAGAAFMVPTALSLIHHSLSDSTSRAKSIGIFGAVGGIAAASGPMLGAILTYIYNWRAVFFVNVPFGLICMWLANYHVKEPLLSSSSYKYDKIGQVLVVICIASITLGLIEVGSLGWSNIFVISSLFVFFMALPLFIFVELKVDAPIFPLHFFRSPTFTAVMIVGIFMNLGFYGELFTLPLYFQEIKGYNALLTGFAISPLMLMVSISSYWAGKVTSDIGPKKPIIWGLVLGAIGFISLLVMLRFNMPYWMMILPLIFTGFGPAFTMPAANIAIMQSVTPNRIGMAAASFNTNRQIGSLIGVAIFGSVLGLSSHLIWGMQINLIIAATVFLLASLIAMILIEPDKLT